MKGKIPYRLQHRYQEITARNKNTKLRPVLAHTLHREDIYASSK
jgi:hypothetical protein